MSQFTGTTILVTLKHPPGAQVRGLVAHVIEQTSTLILQSVYSPADGRTVPTCSVDGAQIADLQIVAAAPGPHDAALAAMHSDTQPAPRAQAFVDPAIMRMGRAAAAAATEEHGARLQTAATGRGASAAYGGESGARRGDGAALAAPFCGLNIADADVVEGEESDEGQRPGDGGGRGGVRRVSVTTTRTGKPMDDCEAEKKGGGGNGNGKGTARRGKRAKKPAVEHDAAGVLEASPEVAKTGIGSGQYRGKGWRQTPILQELGGAGGSPQQQQRMPGLVAGKAGQQAVTSSRKKTKRQRALETRRNNNGWATEDATDIQDLPEFDFAGNLSKFDKRSVFDQIRNEDTTADEERLVSFNRLPAARPGTYGSRNLHPTENVLDGGARGGSGGGAGPTTRASQTDTSSDEFDFDSGRNSLRTMSRASNRRAPPRSNSLLAEDSPAAESGHSHAAMRNINNNRTSVGLGVPRSAYQSNHGSPNLNATGTRFTPPTSPSFANQQQQQQQQAHFRLAPSGLACPTISPGCMLAVEETAEVDFGLRPETLTENAGRGVADVVLAALNPGRGARAPARETVKPARPLCVVFAGNHGAGARALAAARHLFGRELRVLVCVLGIDRAGGGGWGELEREVGAQVEVLRRLGAAVGSWAEVRRVLGRGDGAVEVVLDALGRLFDGLGSEDRRVVGEVLGWVGAVAARGARVVSVDVPSGLNGSTGDVTRDPATNAPLVVPATHVACVGAPRVGLLRALQRQQQQQQQQPGVSAGGADAQPRLDWSLWVVDVGVNRAWKRFGAAGSSGIRFGNEWVVPVAFVAGDGGVGK